MSTKKIFVCDRCGDEFSHKDRTVSEVGRIVYCRVLSKSPTNIVRVKGKKTIVPILDESQLPIIGRPVHEMDLCIKCTVELNAFLEATHE